MFIIARSKHRLSDGVYKTGGNDEDDDDSDDDDDAGDSGDDDNNKHDDNTANGSNGVHFYPHHVAAHARLHDVYCKP